MFGQVLRLVVAHVTVAGTARVDLLVDTRCDYCNNLTKAPECRNILASLFTKFRWKKLQF